MKDKIIMFIIGILLGAVIATGAFYVYTIASNNCNCNNTQMNGNTPPDMSNSQNNSQNGQPPEKPSDDNTQSNSQENNN